MKRAYRYRFYPTPVQAAELSRTFGCVRLVHNRAPAERSAAWHQCVVAAACTDVDVPPVRGGP